MGIRVSREGGAHTNFTTAGSNAGKGLVMLGLFPTERAMTCQGRRSSQTPPSLRLCSILYKPRLTTQLPGTQFSSLQNGNNDDYLYTGGFRKSSDMQGRPFSKHKRDLMGALGPSANIGQNHCLLLWPREELDQWCHVDSLHPMKNPMVT